MGRVFGIVVNGDALPYLVFAECRATYGGVGHVDWCSVVFIPPLVFYRVMDSEGAYCAGSVVFVGGLFLDKDDGGIGWFGVGDSVTGGTLHEPEDAACDEGKSEEEGSLTSR